MILLICIGAPLLGAFLLPILGRRSAKLRNGISLALALLSLGCVALITVAVIRDEAPSLRAVLPLGLTLGLKADALSVFMALTSGAVATAIIVYSMGYMKHYDHLNEFYMMVTFFLGSMMGLVFSTNLIEIYLFWEFSSLCCWRLIGFYRDPNSIQRADKAFIITVLGALVMLLGFFGIYGATGTFDMEALRGVQLPTWATALVLVGILSKSATFPLHSWLPDAGIAPSPVSSLLHAAVLVKIGVYFYARLFVVTALIDPAFHVIVPVVAAVSALISAGCAMVATDLKRVVAYSTISQLAFMLLGLSCGSSTGFVGGMLYIMTHSVAKAGLFLCCGIVEHTVHTKDLTKMGGLAKVMPVTAAAFMLSALSVMGIPPFSGFFAKYLVISGAVEAGQPLLAAVFILGAVMTVLYLLRLFRMVFLGKCAFPDVRESSPAMLGAAVGLASLSLLLGFVMAWPSALATLIGGAAL